MISSRILEPANFLFWNLDLDLSIKGRVNKFLISSFRLSKLLNLLNYNANKFNKISNLIN
jgi:hypothetical protein